MGIGRNELIEDDGTSGRMHTGEREEIDCQLVLRSVGYTGIPLGVSRLTRRGTILNHDGRVLRAPGGHRPGHYTAGWIKRGPPG